MHAQFQPINVPGQITDIAVFADHAVVLSSIHEKVPGWRDQDSGYTNGVFVARVAQGVVDTIVRWLDPYDPFSGGMKPYGLAWTNGGLSFGTYTVTDFGPILLNYTYLNPEHDTITTSTFGVRPVPYTWVLDSYVLCYDSTILEIAGDGRCVKWHSPNDTDTLPSTIGLPQSSTLNKIIFADGPWIMYDCEVEESVLFLTPAIDSTLHFVNDNLIVGWTGTQGCWSTDDGQTWTHSDTLAERDTTSRIAYYHTLDGYDIVAEYWDDSQKRNARISIKHHTNTTWLVHHIPNFHVVQGIYGDSLHNVYIAFDYPWLSQYPNHYPSNLWKYNPAVSVNEPPTNIPVLQRGNVTVKRLVVQLSELNELIIGKGAWSLYSSTGSLVANSTNTTTPLPSVAKGLYLITVGDERIVVIVSE